MGLLKTPNLISPRDHLCRRTAQYRLGFSTEYVCLREVEFPNKVTKGGPQRWSPKVVPQRRHSQELPYLISLIVSDPPNSFPFFFFSSPPNSSLVLRHYITATALQTIYQRLPFCQSLALQSPLPRKVSTEIAHRDHKQISYRDRFLPFPRVTNHFPST